MGLGGGGGHVGAGAALEWPKVSGEGLEAPPTPPRPAACSSPLCCPVAPLLQDVLEVLESWLTLMQQCPRHFRLSRRVLRDMATYALPATGGRGGRAGLMVRVFCGCFGPMPNHPFATRLPTRPHPQ